MTGLPLRRGLFLVLFTVLALLPARISLPPLDRDESRYLEASRQMLQTGDLLDIRFQDRPRWLQPAGIYWLEAGSARLVELVSGSTAPANEAWPYRIPSLVCGVVNVVLTASIGAALFGPEAGFMAGLMLATSVLFDAEGHLATIDTALLTAVLVAMRALLATRNGVRRRAAAAIFWVALGVGLMLKGPVVLLPGLLTPLALSLTEWRRDVWRRLHPGWGVPLMLLVVAPWAVATFVATHGQFFRVAIGHNLLGKVAGGQESHGAPPGTFLALFLASFWPGSLFAVLAIPFAVATRRAPQVRFLLCWIVPTWIAFELIHTKLPHYVLPTYPAIACLAAAALLAPVPSVPRWTRALAFLYGALWLVAGLAYAAAGPVLLADLQGQTENPAGLLAALAGAALLLAAAYNLLRGARASAFLLSAGAAFAIDAGLFTSVIPDLTTIWLSPRIARTVALVRPCPGSVLASTSFSEPSLVFLAGQDTRLIGPEDAAHLLATDRCALALVGSRDESRFHAALTTPVRKLATVDGLNYSTGKSLALSLYTASPRP